MVKVVRAVGWALFGVCAITFVALGGFTAARRGSAVAMAAGIGMPVAMLITVSATTVLNWRAVRRRRPRPEPDRAPEAPSKSYTIRPLDMSKLTPEARRRLEGESSPRRDQP